MTLHLVRQLIEAWNAHDVPRVVALYSPDYVEYDVAQAGPQRGAEGIRRTMNYYLRAFPDLRLIADQIVAQDGSVALAWTLFGTHRGTMMNIPPTGRTVRVRGVTLLTLDGAGRIRRAERIWDLAGLLRALGLLPELPSLP
jgi:steroid delta-isomerase-like uncharacterized protein